MGEAYHASPVFHDNTIYIGGMDGYLYAIDKQTGNEKWKFNSQQPILSTALVANDRVYFISGGKLFAIHMSSGEELWSYCASEQSGTAQFDEWDYHHSSPYINDNVIYFGDDWGNMNGVNAESGELDFRFTSEVKKAIRSTPVIQDNVIFFGDYLGITYAVNILDSSMVWSYIPYENLPYEGFGMSDSKFVIYKDGLYFGSRNPNFYCLDVTNGDVKWKISDSFGSWLSGSPVINNDTLFFGASDNHLFYAIEPETGQIFWTHKTFQNIFTTPLFIGKYICF
jgi:outer membrane protein assembly factor BamB